MRASYGTTKYCMAFLRGVSCSDHSCMNLHEWGDEKDCFTKEDLTTLWVHLLLFSSVTAPNEYASRKHTMKATESRIRNTVLGGKKSDDSDGLPRAAAWAQKGSNSPVTTLHNASNHIPMASSTTRPTRRGTGGIRQAPRSSPIITAHANSSSSSSRTVQERRAATNATKTSSQASSSRPSTPAIAGLPPRPATPAEVKALRQEKEPSPKTHSPPSPIVESDLGSGSQDVLSDSPTRPHSSTDSVRSSVPSVPPGLSAIPPGLSAPPGIPTPSRPPRLGTASPQTPLLASQSSYQMSNAARALLDDVKARREVDLPAAGLSPFPDFDRTLLTLAGGKDGEFGGFSFNLDPKLAGEENLEPLPEFQAEFNIPYAGSYMDAFTGPKSSTSHTFMAPPGLPYPHNHNRSLYDPLAVRIPPIIPLEKQSAGSPAYTGSFNPFADSADEPSSSSPTRRSQYSPSLDDERKVSRFGFARGRQGSIATPSPLHASTPLSNSDGQSFYNSSDLPPQTPPLAQWTSAARQEYVYPASAMASPLVRHAQAQAQAQTSYTPQHNTRFQPFDTGVSEAQLRDLIQSSRDRTNPAPAHNVPGTKGSHYSFKCFLLAHPRCLCRTTYLSF